MDHAPRPAAIEDYENEKCQTGSIIIDSYNYERYVGDAIESALGQDYQDIEVIVVDDGSTDGSRDVIGRYGHKITTVLQPNGGQGAAYNAGFAACRGEIVIFLDSDDRIYPNAASEVVKRFTAGVSKVQFGLNLIDGQGRALGQSLFDSSPDARLFRRLLTRFLSYPHPPGSGNAYSRGFLEKRLPLPLEPWRVCADSCLISAAPVDGTVVHVDACLGEFRRHGSGASDLASGRSARVRQTGASANVPSPGLRCRAALLVLCGTRGCSVRFRADPLEAVDGGGIPLPARSGIVVGKGGFY